MTEEQTKLFVGNLHLAKNTAKRFMWARDTAPLDFHDLFQEAAIALMKAVETFNPDKGTIFRTYAICGMRRQLVNLIRPYTSQFTRRLWFAKPIDPGSDVEDRSTVEEAEPWEPVKSAVECVSELPTRAQSMIVRRFVFGENIRDIACAFGCSYQNVEQIIALHMRKARENMTRMEKVSQHP